MHLELTAAGFFVGLLVGLIGVGGGSIMTPLLLVVFRINPLLAVGTDLAYSVPSKLYAALLHHRQGTVNYQIVVPLIAGGIPAALVGTAILYWLRGHVDILTLQSWIRRAIGSMILFAAAILLVQPFLQQRTARVRPIDAKDRMRIGAAGAIVGFVVAITSIGSGSVTLPLLSLALPYVGLSQLIGSDIAFSALLIPSAAVGHWSMGDVNPSIASNLIIGSLPGVYIGSKLCKVLEQRWLRPAVALTLFFVGARLV
jgi:uncharacterized protein